LKFGITKALYKERSIMPSLKVSIRYIVLLTLVIPVLLWEKATFAQDPSAYRIGPADVLRAGIDERCYRAA
jgi:hypothetical protein